jgi:adenylosuccinate lyase
MQSDETSTTVSRWANVRLTEEEHRALDMIQERLQTTRSRLLRKVIRELIGMGPDLLAQEWKILEDLVYQLAAIGRNLNQWLKAIHTGQAVATPAEQSLIEELRDLVEQVKKEVITAIERSCQRWVKNA